MSGGAGFCLPPPEKSRSIQMSVQLLTGKHLLTYNDRMDRTFVPSSVLLDSTLRAIADPTRRDLLGLLAEGEQPVNRLAEPFAMSRPAISQHLRVLRDAGLVTERRIGRERWYRLRTAPFPGREARGQRDQEMLGGPPQGLG